jgi:hypothetical protein
VNSLLPVGGGGELLDGGRGAGSSEPASLEAGGEERSSSLKESQETKAGQRGTKGEGGSLSQKEIFRHLSCTHRPKM